MYGWDFHSKDVICGQQIHSGQPGSKHAVSEIEFTKVIAGLEAIFSCTLFLFYFVSHLEAHKREARCKQT